MKQHKKPLLEKEPTQSEKDLATIKAIPIKVDYIPQSQEVSVHELREQDPNHIAAVNAGIGSTALVREFRTPENRAAEAEIQAKWQAFADRED